MIENALYNKNMEDEKGKAGDLEQEGRATLIGDMKQRILDPLFCVNVGASNLAISWVKYMREHPDVYNQEMISSVLDDPEVQIAVKKVLAYFLPYLSGEERSLSERLSDNFKVQLSVEEKQAGIEDYLLRFYLPEGYLNIEYINSLAASLGIDLSPSYFAEDRIQVAVRNGLVRRIKQNPNIFDPRTARTPIDVMTDDLIKRFSLNETTMKALGAAFLEKATFEIQSRSQSAFLTEFINKVAAKFALTQDEIKDVGKRYVFKKSKEGHVFENDRLNENPVSNVAKAYGITDAELREIILEGTLAAIGKYILMNGDFEAFKKGLAFWGIDEEAVLKSDKFFAAVVNQVVGYIALRRETYSDEPFGYHALVEYKLMKEGDDPVEAIFMAIAQVFGEDGEELMILNLRSRGAEDYDIERFRANLQVLQNMRRDRI